MNSKSILPPRKRAKTKEEKEQRRVERILRNRRAAHASREKKRKYVEHLESHIKALTNNLEKFQKNQELLIRKLNDSQISVPNLNKIELGLPEFKFDNKKFIKSNLSKDVDDGDLDVDNDDNDDIDSVNEYQEAIPEIDYDHNDHHENQSFDQDQPADQAIHYTSNSDSNSSNSYIETPELLNENLNFINYLSPVSINSPSPIDLSLYNPIEYNSEVVV